MSKRPVYMDYAAATPADPRALKAMMPFLKNSYGNPSSSHALGQQAKVGIEKAREKVAAFLSCSAGEVVFTSGATEANNLAIHGILQSVLESYLKTKNYPSILLGVNQLKTSEKPHIITSAIEHESVLAPIRDLEKRGAVEATYVLPDAEGLVRPSDVADALTPNTALVSIQYANSEIGTVQPIAEISRVLRDFLKTKNYKLKTIFHTDATQAANYLDCSVEKLGVDLLTLSSHKIYGPKGAGALYAKKGVEFSPLLLGGGQEEGRRSGTENVPGIVGMGEACALLLDPRIRLRSISLRQLRDRCVKSALARIPEARITGSVKNRLPNNIHLRLPGVQGKDVVFLMDQKGVCVSTGSACSESSQEASHVLLAMGYSREEALSSVRISLGRTTTAAETARCVKALVSSLDRLKRGGI